MDWINDVTNHVKMYKDRKSLVENVIDSLLSELTAQSAEYDSYKHVSISVTPMRWRIILHVDQLGDVSFEFDYNEIRNANNDLFPEGDKLRSIVSEILSTYIKEALRP